MAYIYLAIRYSLVCNLLMYHNMFRFHFRLVTIPAALWSAARYRRFGGHGVPWTGIRQTGRLIQNFGFIRAQDGARSACMKAVTVVPALQTVSPSIANLKFHSQVIWLRQKQINF